MFPRERPLLLRGHLPNLPAVSVPGGAFVVMTPNLLNYAIIGNAVATKLSPDNLRLRIVHASDSRADEDIFPVCYKANTLPRLGHLLKACGLQLHEAIGL